MCLCVYIGICIRIYIYMYMYLYTRAHIISIYEHTCKHTRKLTHTNLQETYSAKCAHTNTQHMQNCARTQIRNKIQRIYTYIHSRVHTCINVGVCIYIYIYMFNNTYLHNMYLWHTCKRMHENECTQIRNYTQSAHTYASATEGMYKRNTIVQIPSSATHSHKRIRTCTHNTHTHARHTCSRTHTTWTRAHINIHVHTYAYTIYTYENTCAYWCACVSCRGPRGTSQRGPGKISQKSAQIQMYYIELTSEHFYQVEVVV